MAGSADFGIHWHAEDGSVIGKVLLLLTVPYAILLVVIGFLTRHTLAEAGFIRWGAGLLLKSFAWLLALIVLVVGGLIAYQELTKRPPGSPPIWLEGRERYPRGHISDLAGFDNIPVDLWFGKKPDGRVDTTHLRIASDYFGKIPFWHGESAELNVVWPSLRSIDEENEVRAKNGQPPAKQRQVSYMWFAESDSDFKDDSQPVVRCEPMVSDEARGVRYCNELHTVSQKPGERYTWYWPLDDSIRTPYLNRVPALSCTVIYPDGEKKVACRSEFSYNADLRVSLMNEDETLAIDILTHFSKLTDFLHSLEVKP